MTKNKIEQITSSGKTIEIDDVDFKINPITTKEFLKAQVISQSKDRGESVLYMMWKSLKAEDLDKQDIEDSPPKFMMSVQEAMEDVNDFEDFFSEDEQQEALNKLQ